MNLVLESHLENPFTAWAAKTLQCISYKIQGQGNKGNPDRLYLFPNGRHALIEWKRPGEEPTKLQKLKHKRLAAMLQPIEVFDNVERAKQWFYAIASMDPPGLPTGRE